MFKSAAGDVNLLLPFFGRSIAVDKTREIHWLLWNLWCLLRFFFIFHIFPPLFDSFSSSLTSIIINRTIVSRSDLNGDVHEFLSNAVRLLIGFESKSIKVNSVISCDCFIDSNWMTFRFDDQFLFQSFDEYSECFYHFSVDQCRLIGQGGGGR